MAIRLVILFALCTSASTTHAQTDVAKGDSLKQRMLRGDKLSNPKVPTNATREKIHSIIKEKKPDMLYLDAHHRACTEWDIDRIVKAAQEMNVPVMMRIDHADQAGMISSMLDLGLFSIKVPTV